MLGMLLKALLMTVCLFSTPTAFASFEADNTIVNPYRDVPELKETVIEAIFNAAIQGMYHENQFGEQVTKIACIALRRVRRWSSSSQRLLLALLRRLYCKLASGPAPWLARPEFASSASAACAREPRGASGAGAWPLSSS